MDVVEPCARYVNTSPRETVEEIAMAVAPGADVQPLGNSVRDGRGAADGTEA